MTKTALLFPAESSHSVGMMSGMANRFSSVRDTFNEASEVLGYDLWSVVDAGPEAELNKAEIKKPAMLADFNRLIAPETTVFNLTDQNMISQALEVENDND